MCLAVCLAAGMVLNVQASTIEEAQQKANQLENEKNAVQAEQTSLTDQLNKIATEMEDINKKLETKQTEIAEAEEMLVQAKVDENGQYQDMKKRIRYMYENGNAQLLEILFSSESMGDFLNRAEYVSMISEYDRDMLVQFQEVVEQVQAQEASLKSEYEELSGLQTQLVDKHHEVQTLLDNASTKLADLEGQIGANAAALQNLIAQAEAERVKQEQQAAAAAAAAAASAAASASSGGAGGSSYVPASSSNVVVSGNAQFTNPCPGATVSSPFGYRDFDSSFHNGLDLAAGEGTPTYAADAGTVIIAGWSDSAGNWVVIDHGNGFVTKYMHHSALAVSAGQTVSKGQQVGYVGNTGNSFGAHLHFQVELNGSPVNPQSYL